jgi:hypothetical protein
MVIPRKDWCREKRGNLMCLTRGGGNEPAEFELFLLMFPLTGFGGPGESFDYIRIN